MSARIIMLSHHIRDLLFHLKKNTSKFGEPWLLQCNTQFYCGIPWHILHVLMTLSGKMGQEWNNNT